MKTLRVLYTIYALTIFVISCFLFVPILVVLSQKKQWHYFALKLHKPWAWIYCILTFIRVKIEHRFKPDPKQQYIICANHFSYFDIPSVFLRFTAKFIGKSSIARVPVFGYFYRKIHITVNRESLRSRGESLRQTRNAVNEGFNVAFFPEGGVKVLEKDLPQMVPFRDGAFLLSYEKGIPIIPVTLPYSFKIFPDRKPVLLSPHMCKLVIHEPVYPDQTNKENAEVQRMKQIVAKVIQDELNAHHPDKVQSVK